MYVFVNILYICALEIVKIVYICKNEKFYNETLKEKYIRLDAHNYLLKNLQYFSIINKVLLLNFVTFKNPDKNWFQLK